ncbi:MAG: hypothetical protein SFY70_12755 [Bacteroidia bacterium]|nr:hypothetical protein [Bacteroidia bacterium]
MAESGETEGIEVICRSTDCYIWLETFLLPIHYYFEVPAPGIPSNSSVLIISPWPIEDGLTAAYTRPYLSKIRAQVQSTSTVVWFTYESRTKRLAAGKKRSIKEELLAEGIIWHSTAYVNTPLRGILWLAKTWLFLCWLVVRYRVSVLHTWTLVPMLVAVPVRWITRTQLVADSFEPHADAMLETGTWTKKSVFYRLSSCFERLGTRQARYWIPAASGMNQYALNAFGAADKTVAVKPGGVDFSSFDPVRFSQSDRLFSADTVVGVYLGKFGGLYWQREVFDFFSACRTHWGDSFHALLISPTEPAQIHRLAAAAGYPSGGYSVYAASHVEVPYYLAQATFALNATHAVPSRRYGSPIKDAEYWAMGLPVVLLDRLSDDSFLATAHKLGVILQGLSPEAYQHGVVELASLLEAEPTAERKARIRGIAQVYRSYAIADPIYAYLYGSGPFPSENPYHKLPPH